MDERAYHDIRMPSTALHIDTMTHLEFRVYAAVRSRQGARGFCTATRSTIAADIGVHKSTVVRSISALKEAGWMTENRSGIRCETPARAGNPGVENKDLGGYMRSPSVTSDHHTGDLRSPGRSHEITGSVTSDHRSGDFRSPRTESQKENQKENQNTKSAREDSEAVRIAKEITGYHSMPIGFQERINLDVYEGELDAWRDHLQFWSDCDYNLKNINSICSSFREQQERKKDAEAGGRNQGKLSARQYAKLTVEEKLERAGWK